MKRLLVALLCTAVLLGMWTLQGQTQDPEQVRTDNVKTFMRAKLRHAQDVLEGLVVEDYDKIAKHSQEMSLLSLASNWQVLQTPKYAEHSRDFRKAADRITKEAKSGNLDGATLGYVELTMKCVNCHKYVRQVQVGQVGPLDGPDESGLKF